MRTVRRALAADAPAVRRLCAETGQQGDPVPAEEADAFAERWAGPYLKLRPDWTFVAEEDGRVVAYLTGCPDSAAFEAEVRAKLEPTPDSRAFFAALKEAGVPSAHVFCGNRALGYWVKAGFSPIGSCEPAPGVFIHALARAV